MMKERYEPKRNGTVSIIKILFCSIIVIMHYGIPSTINGSEYMFGGGIFLLIFSSFCKDFIS